MGGNTTTTQNTTTQTTQTQGAATGTQTGAAGTPASNETQQGTQQTTQQNGGNSAFDDFLKGEGMQAEFDRRVAKALKTQETRLNADLQTRINTAVAEAQKVAKMTKDQQDEYNRQKQAEALAEREAAITRRELTASAKETLASKGLPLSLADVLDYTDADKTKASIEAVEKAFQGAVQTTVEEKLKGGKAPTKAQGGNSIEDVIARSMKTGFFGY